MRLRIEILLSLLLCLGPSLSPAQGSPQSYGPEFKEPGLREKGNYLDAGFQATVNPYGGNLVVSATDVSIPSQGHFNLHFTRTYNSHKVALRNLQHLGEVDGPLGPGWTCHYGILTFSPSGGVFYIDPTGARERFYPNNHLSSLFPNSGSWISPSLKTLWVDRSRTGATMLTPSGLTYEFAPVHIPSARTSYPFLVPVRIQDVHGNAWTLSYRFDRVAYPEHPLVHEVVDPLGRRLQFMYEDFHSGAPGGLRSRLKELKLKGTLMASYGYIGSPRAPQVLFLRTHTTPEGRVTTYTTDFTPNGSTFGDLTEIGQPTGGMTRVHYGIKQFSYQPGRMETVYAVTSVEQGGHTWTSDYLSDRNRQPTDSLFKVRVTTPDYQAVYDYWTYGPLGLSTRDLWKVGLLISKSESYRGTLRTSQYAYAPGAMYILIYDVHGRLMSKKAHDLDEHEYIYRTGPEGVTTTHTIKAPKTSSGLREVVYQRKVDCLGRIVEGSTNGHKVIYTYTEGAEGSSQTIQPEGLPPRTVVRDYRGEKVREVHPETGEIKYEYNTEGWLKKRIRPGSTHEYVYDKLRRLKDAVVLGRAVASWNYDPTYGDIARTDQVDGVTVLYMDRDGLGRPQTVWTIIRRALEAPIPKVVYRPTRVTFSFYDYSTQTWRSGTHNLIFANDLPEEAVLEWDAVAGAAKYDIEIREGQSRWGPFVWETTKKAQMELKGLGLQLWKPYEFRVRALGPREETGPFGPWVPYRFQGTKVSTLYVQSAGVRGYDQDGNPVWRTGGTWVRFETKLAYDTLGRLAKVTHPNRDPVAYPYVNHAHEQV